MSRTARYPKIWVLAVLLGLSFEARTADPLDQTKPVNSDACSALLKQIAPEIELTHDLNGSSPSLSVDFQHYKPFDSQTHPNFIGADFQSTDLPTGVSLPEGFTFSAHYKWRTGTYSKEWAHQIDVARDGETVGFIRFSDYPEFLALNVREVVPKYRDQKLGKRLIEAMFQAVEKKPAKIESLVAHTNYKVFTDGLRAGLTPEQAAAGTPTGKTLLEAGYTLQRVIADPATLKKFPASFAGRDNRYLVANSKHDYQSSLSEPCLRFVRADPVSP